MKYSYFGGDTKFYLRSPGNGGDCPPGYEAVTVIDKDSKTGWEFSTECHPIKAEPIDESIREDGPGGADPGSDNGGEPVFDVGNPGDGSSGDNSSPDNPVYGNDDDNPEIGPGGGGGSSNSGSDVTTPIFDLKIDYNSFKFNQFVKGLPEDLQDLLEEDEELKNKIFDFFTENESLSGLGHFSEENEEFAEEALKAIDDGGDEKNIDYYYKVINDLDNDCLKDIYEDIGKTSEFKQRVKAFDSNFSVADLRFSEDSDFSSTFDSDYDEALGATIPPANSNLIEIIFNTDDSTPGYILNKPNVFKVVTFIHEVLHAEMYRKMLDAIINSDSKAEALDWSTQEEFDAYLESLENKYFGIFDYYTRFNYGIPTNQDPNDYQHEQMAQHYRDVIIQTLTEYDSSLSEEDKEALFWLGLNYANIKAWQNLEPEDRTTINQKINSIQNSFPNECD